MATFFAKKIGENAREKERVLFFLKDCFQVDENPGSFFGEADQPGYPSFSDFASRTLIPFFCLRTCLLSDFCRGTYETLFFPCCVIGTNLVDASNLDRSKSGRKYEN